MNTHLSARNPQTRVKHEILAKYLDRWCGIILRGLHKSKRNSGWHFVYVDCFAYKGMYCGESEDVLQNRPAKPVFGSPIIGIRALDKLANYASKNGIHVTTNAILIERDPATYKILRETLRLENLSQRVIETTKFSDLLNGQIAIVNCDTLSLADDLLRFTTRKYTWAFYFLDPYGPSGIPYDFVKSIVQREHHDVMINFMYEDFIRKAGNLKRHIGEQNIKHLGYWTDVFKSNEWKHIVRETIEEIKEHQYWRDDILGGIPIEDIDGFSVTDEQLDRLGVPLLSDEQLRQLKEGRFVSLYRDTLKAMDPKLAVKLIALRFPDKDRTMFYLFLTTHDPTGALAMNEILDKAKYLENELRYRYILVKKTVPDSRQLPLFNLTENIKKPEVYIPERKSIGEIANEIYDKFAGLSLTKREVYSELADTLYFPTEVNNALKHLKNLEKVEFVGKLVHDTMIKFS